MIPTADEVARVIVASFRMVGADPMRITEKLPQGKPSEFAARISHGRGYAAMALRKLFPSLSNPAIGRLVGSNATYTDDLFRSYRRGTLRWYDETDFRQILANCGVEPRETVQIVVDETAPSLPPGAAPPQPYPVRFGAKKRLEDELREAVLNTARMQRAQEGEVP